MNESSDSHGHSYICFQSEKSLGINGYSGKEGLQEAAEYMVELLKEFASAEDVQLIEF